MSYSKIHNSELHSACKDGDVTEVLKLVGTCAHKINVPNNGGFTPLHLDCYYGHREVVKILMLAGADERAIDDGGMTPAQLAERKSHFELLELLDRVSLWEVLHRNKIMNKLNASFLIMLSLHLLRLKLMKIRWPLTLKNR